jgi:hypothetical protein
MKVKLTAVLTAIVSMLAGFATAPQGPSVLVLPGSMKSFDDF